MSRTRRAAPSPGSAVTSSPWILVAAGVVVMVVLLVVALGSVRGRRAHPAQGPTDPAMSLPGLPVAPATTTAVPPAASGTAARPVAPGLSPRSTVLPARPTPAVSTGSPRGDVRPAPPAPSPPPPAPSSAVTGRYGVVSTFDGGFIGEVLLVNTGRSAQGWTVRVTFPRGRLVTAWVEGAEQGPFGFDGRVFTHRSGVDLAAGASVPVRFHVEATGTTRPDACAVDGVACSGR
ncbi:cellulose binding domain-containing protein [Micromonospora sp. WMMD980]|uniref:cellulose binding domain-containing protein n=1 Tax=Micromonospora sp. WMMD980 TaxID=3016088 RepID=UPI002417DFD3|nr:cellulose binding domain-containing protein [Micromonospora sp. WMMD980]MDG4799822.1 cellulose binding domain-containing protein [Micromonospora sp. WMMD980]